MKNISIIITILFVAMLTNYPNKATAQNRFDFVGTLWTYHLKGALNDSLRLVCDSTFIEYDAESGFYYFGTFSLNQDTLILKTKRKFNWNGPLDTAEMRYLIQKNNRQLYLFSVDGEIAKYHGIYKYKSRINCNEQSK